MSEMGKMIAKTNAQKAAENFKQIHEQKKSVAKKMKPGKTAQGIAEHLKPGSYL